MFASEVTRKEGKYIEITMCRLHLHTLDISGVCVSYVTAYMPLWKIAPPLWDMRIKEMTPVDWVVYNRPVLYILKQVKRSLIWAYNMSVIPECAHTKKIFIDKAITQLSICPLLCILRSLKASLPTKTMIDMHVVGAYKIDLIDKYSTYIIAFLFWSFVESITSVIESEILKAANNN